MKKQLKKHFSFIIAVLMVISLIIIPRTAQAASVKLNKTKLTMNVGGVYHLKVSGTNKKVTWSSTDSKVASVSSGKVKAKTQRTSLMKRGSFLRVYMEKRAADCRPYESVIITR